jgi:uncharacterized membrane protein (DUF485 family)
MLNRFFETFKEKSPKERFLLVIGLLFFLMYLVLGCIVVFWKDFPLIQDSNFRIAFGFILILYAFIRFIRFFNANK